MEQRPARSQTLRDLVYGCAVAMTVMGAAGCWQPTQSAGMAVPAARQQGEDRPLKLMSPVELATPRDAVVRLVGDVTCTGTLIADDRVLTAHHCVSARDAKGRVQSWDIAPEDIQIELGGDYLPWGEVKVRAIVAPQCGFTGGDGDIAILVLERHLIGMPTSAPRIESAPELRDQVAVFGFGRCAHSADGVHRVPRDADTIERVWAGQFQVPAAICPGDSGGPVYSSKGDLIGVVSAGVMGGDEHTPRPSLSTRVDAWRQLFAAAHEISLGASPSELPPFGDCHAVPQRPPAR